MEVCISRRRSEARLVSGTKRAGRAKSPTSVTSWPAGMGSENVLGQHHPDDVAIGAIAQGIAGKAMLGRQCGQRGDVGVPIDSDHVGAGNHHLADDRVGELEDGVDQFPLLLLLPLLPGDVESGSAPGSSSDTNSLAALPHLAVVTRSGARR